MYRFAALFLVLTATLPALAADRKFDADANAKTIAPYIDERTVAVLHVDLDAIDVDALMKKADSVIKLVPEEKANIAKMLSTFVDTLKKAGAHDYYLVVSLADFPEQGPFSVIPLGKTGDPKAVLKLFEKMKIH